MDPAPEPPIGLSTAGLVACLALLLAVGFGVFGAGLSGPFVYDDTDAIVENTTLTSFASALSPPADTSFAGRPLVNLSMAIDRELFGLEPEKVHRTNLLLHVLCIALGMAIVRRVVAGPRLASPQIAEGVALGAGLLALVHPLNSEVVYYASPRSELVLAVCFLATFLAVVRRVSGGGTGWLVAAIAFAWLGALSKEVMAVVPPLALLFVGAYFADGFGDAWRKHRTLFLGLATSWLPLAYLVASTPRSQSVGFAIVGGPLDYLKAQCLVLPAYLLRVVWPADLVFDYGMLLPVSWGQALPGFVALGVGFVVAVVLTWKRPALGFPFLFAFVVLGPSSSLVPIVTEIGADRRVYLPLFVGLATVLVLVAKRVGPRGGVVAALAGVVLAVPLGLVSHARGKDYQSHLALWESVTRARPGNPRAWYNVAEQYALAGRFDLALPAIEKAVQLFPGEGSVRRNHAACLANTGRLDEALAEYEVADQLEPLTSAKVGQLRVLAALGRADEARRRLAAWPKDAELSAAAAQLGLISGSRQ